MRPTPASLYRTRRLPSPSNSMRRDAGSSAREPSRSDASPRAVHARTSNPPRTFAVLCTTEVVERMLESNGLPPPSEQDADRDLTVLYWR